MSMPRASILGIGIEYELLGKPGAPTIVLTPGGRFPKDGMRELGEALVAGGKQVLLWDRPNCGESEVSFAGESESELNAQVLLQLIRTLKLGRVALLGGSAGSRVSLIATARDPELVSHLMVFWISGEPIGMAHLAVSYTFESAMAATLGGMEAVAALPSWAPAIASNPRNREIILSQDRDKFIETMQSWARSFVYSDISPVPGLSPEDFAKIRMPTLIYRNGKGDLYHPPRTTDKVHKLIPQSILEDAPWPDNEFTVRGDAFLKDKRNLWEGWIVLVPRILEFTKT
jgi:pimeloyl-ACP methyl ester carboxylesterase